MASFQCRPIAELLGGIHCSDNLTLLRAIPSFSVQLIYLDPPFNSQRDYNILCQGAAAQEKAFTDMHKFDPVLYRELTDPQCIAMTDENMYPGGIKIRENIAPLLIGWKTSYVPLNSIGYLCNMTARLLECHRVLSERGGTSILGTKSSKMKKKRFPKSRTLILLGAAHAKERAVSHGAASIPHRREGTGPLAPWRTTTRLEPEMTSWERR